MVWQPVLRSLCYCGRHSTDWVTSAVREISFHNSGAVRCCWRTAWLVSLAKVYILLKFIDSYYVLGGPMTRRRMWPGALTTRVFSTIDKVNSEQIYIECGWAKEKKWIVGRKQIMAETAMLMQWWWEGFLVKSHVCRDWIKPARTAQGKCAACRRRGKDQETEHIWKQQDCGRRDTRLRWDSAHAEPRIVC